jgi:hypothetical protein
MRTAQTALLVGLEDKMKEVASHWAAVDAALSAEHPLVLLSGVNREGFKALRQGLSPLRGAVVDAEVRLKVSRSAYELHKRELHRLLILINSWMRGNYRWTSCFALVRRVPGLGQSYQHWWDAALTALVMWDIIVKERPGPPECPITLGNGWTVDQFEEFVMAFEVVYWAITPAEVKLEIERSALRMAQAEATALLMAYGHGVRARLGQKAALVRSMPQLWPKHKARKKAA